MNGQTIAGVVNGIQTGQQTLGQAITAIENGINEILAAVEIPGGTGGDTPSTDLTNVVASLAEITTLLGSPATGSLASDIAANSDAIASLTSSIDQLTNVTNGVSTVVTSNATAINNVDANVTSVGTQVSALATQITALQNSIAALAAIVGDFGSVNVPSVPMTSRLLRKLAMSRQ